MLTSLIILAGGSGLRLINSSKVPKQYISIGSNNIIEYFLDASPLVIKSLRHHCRHLTGVYPYEYGKHHIRDKKKLQETVLPTGKQKTSRNILSDKKVSQTRLLKSPFGIQTGENPDLSEERKIHHLIIGGGRSFRSVVTVLISDFV